MLVIIPSLMMYFLIQTTFFVSLNAKIHSILIAESTLVFYLELFQLTTPLFRVKYNHIRFFIFNI